MKKGIALMLAAVLTASTVGGMSGTFYVQAAEDMTPIVTWDFSQDIAGWSYNTGWDSGYNGTDNTSVVWDETSQALKASVDYSLDSDQSWSQLGICYWTDQVMDLTGAQRVTFDMTYNPADKTTGTFSVKAFSNAGIDQYVEIDESAAQTTSDGLLKNEVTIDFTALTEEQGSAVNDLTLALIGVNTDYHGDIFVDNVTVYKVADSTGETDESGETETGETGESETAGDETDANVKMAWDFAEGIDGWYYDANNGWNDSCAGKDAASVAWDEAAQALKLSVDYSQDAGTSWSQLAVNYWTDDAMDLTGVNNASFDLIYDPANRTTGTFTVKVFSNAGIGDNAYIPVDESNGETTEDGLIKVPVSVDFEAMTAAGAAAANDFTICLIGVNTDFAGDVYIDNVQLSAAQTEPSEDTSVDSTLTANGGNPVQSSGSSLTVTNQDGSSETVNYATSVSLADSEADADVVALYQYLQAVGKSDSVIYGHQNDTWHKAGSSALSNSDTYDVTGMYAGVVGIDTLSLTGNEYSASRYNSEMAGTAGFSAVDTEGQSAIDANIEAAAKLTNYNITNGSIITLSAHMPNFSIVAQNPNYDPATDATYEKYDFTGYTPNTLTGDVMNNILPGGAYNEQYTAYLDMIAAYAKQVDGPIMFRPFHEATGSWFWWGAAFCNAETYKSVFKYTVEYLRDEKDVHNMLYLYGPGSEAASAEEYAVRYPGDGYVDLIGFDMYDSDPVDAQEVTWFNNLRNQLNIVQTFADAHGKLMAVTETGVASSSADPGHSQTALHETGNNNLNWYNMVLDAVSASDASYYLLWANFGKTSGYYTPYVDSVNEDGTLHGHEMLDGFISFFNDNRSIFAADQMGVLNMISAPGVSSPIDGVSGYITAPVAGSRINEPMELTARISGADASTELAFVLTGETQQTISGQLEGSVLTAQLDAQTLEAVGQSAEGTLAVTANGEKIAEISVLFNIEQAAEDPYEIDSFENYYGVDSMLTTAWAMNRDSGCTLSLSLTADDALVYDGDYAMVFNYEETETGWGGATITKEVDWSDCDALQFYTIPDGNNQKVVIQITANGTVYEAYLNEYADYAADTDKTPLLVTIPFADFVQRDTAGNPAGGLVTDCSNINSFGLWVNAIPGSDAITDGMVSGTIIYDKITAVSSGQTEATFEPVTSDPEVPGETEETETETEVPETPGETEDTEVPETPGETGDTEVPETPGETEDTEVPETPADTEDTQDTKDTQDTEDTQDTDETKDTNKPADTTKPTSGNNGQTGSGQNSNQNSDSVKTGDNAPIAAAALLMVAAGGAAVVLLRRKFR